MKFLLVNSVVENRSTGQIVREMYSFLKKEGHEAIVCYGRGTNEEDNTDFFRIESTVEIQIHGVMARITGLQGYYSNYATYKLIKKIDSYQPDVIILGNIHGYYINAFRFLKAIKKRKILTYYYMFDEHAFLGKCAFFDNCDKYLTECKNCPKRRAYPKSMIFDTSNKIYNDKLKVYSDFKTLRFTGVPYTVERSKKSALFRKSNAIVYSFGWGIDTHGAFIPLNADDLKRKLNIPERNKVILAVAPYSNSRKGIKDYYYKIAEELCGENISFVHVGFDGELGDAPANVITIPFVSSQTELAKFFSMADLFVIPSISEGYPTVCLDSLSCGTPICGFNISGTPYVAGEPYGTFVTPFSIEELKNVILKANKKTKAIIDSCREYAEKNLDSDIINKKALQQMKDDLMTISKNHKEE